MSRWHHLDRAPTPLAELGGPVDHDVVIVGAGLSGIGAAHRIRQGVPGVRLAVLEARERLGGTWDLFRYPGIRSDSDMFTLAFPFAPWRRPESIAHGADIRDYLQQVADDEGITGLIRFSHTVTGADFDSAQARWTLTVQTPEGRRTTTCRFLHLCAGYYSYNRPYDPQLPGLADFAGEVVHPQHWPADLRYADRRVVVIGSGATAVTLVPALVSEGDDGQVAAAVTMLQRSPTWIGSVPQRDPVSDLARRLLPPGPAHQVARVKNVAANSSLWLFTQLTPRLARRTLTRRAERDLGGDATARAVVEQHLTPRYDPWEQRLCAAPDGDFFSAVRSGRAQIVTATIERIVADGVRLTDGRTLPADVLVTATGLEVQVAGGLEPVVDGTPVRLGEQVALGGALLTGLPNLAFTIGYINASWTLRADLTAQLVTWVLRWMQDRGHAVVQPIPDPSVQRRPLMDLDAGYLRRARDRIPAQGDTDPWRMRQSFLPDALAVRRLDLDEVLSAR